MHWSSRMMNQAHWSCEVLKWMWIDWLDLPKLTTLRTRDYSSSDRSYSFRLPRHITLESDSHSLWMMFRHAQSHQCVSSNFILVQEWRHNQRRYSSHSSLTNRHRSSSKLLQLITERHVTPLFVPHTTHNTPLPSHLRAHSAALERALSLCEHGNNDDPHLKWWKSNQNRGNDNKWSFPPYHLKSTPNNATYHLYCI